MNLIPRSGEVVVTTPGHYDYWQYDTSRGVTVKWASGDPIVGKTDQHYNGYATPYFHRRSRAGELLPHTPWTKYSGIGAGNGSVGPLRSVVSGNDIDTWYTTGSYPIGDSWVYEDDLVALVPSDAIGLTQNAAAAIVGESHDTLTFLAELADTKRMFLKAGKRLLSLKFPKNWRQMSNDWLSYRYGWRTFMYDCEDLHKAFSRLDEKRSRYSKRSKSISSWSDASTSHYTSAVLGTNFSQTQTRTVKYEISCVGSVSADIVVPPFKFNVIDTAWELIPYSFVVDWFIGVGKSLAAFSFLTSATSYVASWGCQVSADLTVETTGYSVKPGTTGNLQSTCTGKASYEVRVPCRVPLTPQLSFKVDMAKVADLVAMVVQRM